MVRSIATIKNSLTADWIANPDVITAYGLVEGKTFDDQFSQASLESIFFYIVASEMNTLETALEEHKVEVNNTIQSIIPHRPKWYRDKALDFMVDKTLPVDVTNKAISDVYDTTGMSDAEITAARVIKYATANEESGSSVLVIKIATEASGVRAPVDSVTEAQFAGYIGVIRDAGVKVSIVNLVGDDFYCELDIYYSPLLLVSDVETLVKTAISGYITGLSFNGEYSNMALVDAIQSLEGIPVVEFKSAKTNNTFINGKTTPLAGYFTYTEANVTINLIPYNVNL